MNDVLQHVDEADVAASVAELRRVLRPDGALLVRTNGGRTDEARSLGLAPVRRALAARGARAWRLPDPANHIREPRLVAVGCAQGKGSEGSKRATCGIPEPARSASNAIGRAVLGQEARYLRGSGRRLPYGHTLFAVAVPLESR